jgi:hypothetical protein
VGHNLDAFKDILHGGLARRKAITSPRLPVYETSGSTGSRMGRTLTAHRRWPLQCTLTDPVRVASSIADAYVSGSHDDVAHIR